MPAGKSLILIKNTTQNTTHLPQKPRISPRNLVYPNLRHII